MVAEDNDMLTRILEYRLQFDGFKLKIFNNGEEALEFMKESEFGLLITNLNLPLMNGIELIKAVRDSVSKTVPVIAISTFHSEDLRVQSINVGANDFVVKPFRFGELSLRIKRLLKGS